MKLDDMLQVLHTTCLREVDTISFIKRLNGNTLEDDGKIIFLMKEKVLTIIVIWWFKDRCEAFWFKTL